MHGVAWLERTGGELSRGEQLAMLRPILRGQAQGIAGRVSLALGRRATSQIEVPAPPDSALAREAESAAAEQSASLLGHAHRTWAFGRALAVVDGVTLDDELFYVAALLHDVGLMQAVAGEDFTMRSCASASAVASPHRPPQDIAVLCDAIVDHATPGITVDEHGAEAFYVQTGATCDLGGLRLHHLTASHVESITDAHPRHGFAAEIVGRVRAESDAMPEGRFAVLRRTGFTLAIRLAPFAES